MLISNHSHFQASLSCCVYHVLCNSASILHWFVVVMALKVGLVELKTYKLFLRLSEHVHFLKRR